MSEQIIAIFANKYKRITKNHKTMKVLSVQQPWASLICAGIKDVENRTWKAAKVPGRILIHASSKKVTKNFFAGIPEHILSFINNEISFGNFPELDTLPTSAIVGYVTVTAFEEGNVNSIWSDGPGVIKWKLEDAWMFDEPILNVKGKLNLFDYDEIDENNLPPAHKEELEDIWLSESEDEVFIPCEKSAFEKIETGDFKAIELFLTAYLVDVLCVEDEFKMKPFKAVTVYCGNKYIAFELADGSGIFNLPDPQDESKPYMIFYPDGSELAWMTAQFNFGKKLEEGEFDNACEETTIQESAKIQSPKAKEDENVLKFKVSKDVFKDIVSGEKTFFHKEITQKSLSTFFEVNENGTVKEINGVPQLRRYDAIQFINKDDSYTCQINNADVMYFDSEYGNYMLYTELEEDERVDYTECFMEYALGDKK